MQQDVSTMVIEGIGLRVDRRGAGPPLLLLHGGDGPQDHLPFFASLAERFEIIAPVHPGFAGSTIPDYFDGMEDLVYLYLDLMDTLDLREVVLMGFSMGGWAAVEIAVRNTSRLSKLILVDAVGIKPGDRETRDITDIFGLPGPEVIKLMFHDPSRAPNLSAMSEEQLTVMAGDRIAHALYTWDPYMHNPKLRYRLHRIDVPTLLMWGESDRMVSVAYAEVYRTLIPGARLVVISQAGHLPQLEQPDLFVEHVLSFVAR
ncbi:MAG: alpha/beta hydrolase [Nitrospinae bacterium]|nr:alpha/beta hydrolase [Nitrospinota bacterium]